MVTAEEKKFLEYWAKNRDKHTNIFKQLRYGLLIGLGLAALTILNFTTGWYSRATMVANSQSTPLILIIAIIAIVIFWSVFSRRHKWEMNEQRYREILSKQKNDLTDQPVQQ